MNPELCKHIENVFSSFGITNQTSDSSKLLNANYIPELNGTTLKVESNGFVSEFVVPSGGVPRDSKEYVNNEYQNQTLLNLLQSHASSDICIIGNNFYQLGTV